MDMEREDEEKQQKVTKKELEQKLEKVEAEKKNLTEQLEWSDCLRRTAEIRAAKLKLDLTRSRKATEKAIEEKDEAEKEAKKAKDEVSKMNKKIESINSNLVKTLDQFVDKMYLQSSRTFCPQTGQVS